MDSDGCPTCPECPDDSLPFSIVVSLLASAVLICLSALFSGLTLGLMSLDISGLKIVAEAGKDADRAYARQIMPLRKRGNLLLCTLLVGNVIVNSCVSILLADVSGGLVGLIVSSGLITLLGEILPQAICSRYGLFIGARTRFITIFLMIILLPVTYPIAKVLDWMLGKEVGTTYSREELKQLLQLHATVGAEDGASNGIDHEDHNLLAGALEYSHKAVRDVMTPLERVFMLEASARLDFDLMLEIYKSGYTRIPVYEGSRDCIRGMLYVKDLILVDPDDEIPLETIISFRKEALVRFISDNTSLGQVFRIFKKSYTHIFIGLAFYDPKTGTRLPANASEEQLREATREVTGVITLEDILEEMIRDEIVDEYDEYIDNTTTKRVHKATGRPDISSFMALFAHKVRKSHKLSRHEVYAITAFLTARIAEFAVFEAAPAQLRQLITASDVVDVEDGSEPSSPASDQSGELLPRVNAARVDDALGSHRVLYVRGTPSDVFTLMIQGRALVWAGEEAFESELGPWSSMGNAALSATVYKPDFSALTSGPCRMLRVSRDSYARAVDAVARGRGGAASGRAASSSASPVRAIGRQLTPIGETSGRPESEGGGQLRSSSEGARRVSVEPSAGAVERSGGRWPSGAPVPASDGGIAMVSLPSGGAVSGAAGTPAPAAGVGWVSDGQQSVCDSVTWDSGSGSGTGEGRDTVPLLTTGAWARRQRVQGPGGATVEQVGSEAGALPRALRGNIVMIGPGGAPVYLDEAGTAHAMEAVEEEELEKRRSRNLGMDLAILHEGGSDGAVVFRAKTRAELMRAQARGGEQDEHSGAGGRRRRDDAAG